MVVFWGWLELSGLHVVFFWCWCGKFCWVDCGWCVVVVVVCCGFANVALVAATTLVVAAATRVA